MKNISNILLLTNLCVLIISIAIVFFWTELGLNDSQEVYIGLFGVIIFGLSLAGVFVGFLEKRNKEKSNGRNNREFNHYYLLFEHFFIHHINNELIICQKSLKENTE